jgi:putative membrane protein
MVIGASFAFLHFVAVFGIVSAIALEWQTMSRNPSYAEARRLQRCDQWYGIFALVVLIVGFLRVFYFEKGPAFYMASPFFQAKIALFILVGLLSIYPTMRFRKWRPHTSKGEAPAISEEEYRRIMLFLRTELVLLLGVALCASLMSRAVGL